MMGKVSETLLSKLGDFVGSRLGLHFPRERWNDLERGARAASRECAFEDDVERFIGRMLSSALTQSELETLASHLTVGETYFFREKSSLEVFEQKIVPELIRTRRGFGGHIRIWSAGCATGEEPYSLAIVLSRMIADLKEWKITILATDLNTRSLQKAAEGIYTDWSFRDTPHWVKSTYFKANPGGRWAISPAIKKMVTFSYLNLVEDLYPSLLNCTNAMDVILCRNVLMYFTGEAVKKVIHGFQRSLADAGWLIVSPAETSQTLFTAFTSVSIAGATLYGKGAANRPHMVTAPFSYAPDEVQVSDQATNLATPDSESTWASNPDASLALPDTDRPPETLKAVPLYEQALEGYQRGCYEDAAQIVVALLSQNENDARAMLLLARVYANQGKLTAAITWCDKAIASDKMTACAHYLRATILQEQDLPEEAVRSLRRAVYIDPRFVLGHFALGSLALGRGEPKESERHFENVLLLLASYGPEETVPESEGLSARRLTEIVTLQRNQKTLASRRSPGATRRAGGTEIPTFGGQ
jgi:chemotaxis protein methyltransferase CheR